MSIPQSANKAKVPLVVAHDHSYQNRWTRFLPAGLASGIFHGLLLLLLFLLMPGEGRPGLEPARIVPILADARDDDPKDPHLTEDVDPAAKNFDTDLQFRVERKDIASIPGRIDPSQGVGIQDGALNLPPISMAVPRGFGVLGPGGGADVPGKIGTGPSMGYAGGLPHGVTLPGSIYARGSAATREWALKDGGGTGASEAAVTRGLNWLVRHQWPDGKWMLDDPRFKDRGTQNDIAATAFGLLPFLGAGKTHKQGKEPNPYDKPIEKALAYLVRKQSKKTGDFGGGMYAHGLATIAMCEAFGLTHDQNLRRPAQMAVNYIVNAQHDGGGWRYTPNQAGDTSVTGWQIMALKSAQMAGLDVPDLALRKAQKFLDSMCNPADEGYGYVAPGSTPAMSAVGLLCRQYLQSWGPKNPRLLQGVKVNLEPTLPNARNMYYSYYATQVLHHFGGESWKKWNDKMREDLVQTQDQSSTAMSGSWSSVGDPHSSAGGRLMQTSLSMLTLEVYYRHLPLYYRETGEAMAGVLKGGEK